jgi:hypothetical protein
LPLETEGEFLMKRLFSIVTLLVLSLSLLTACGAAGKADRAESAQSAGAVFSQAPSAAPAPAPAPASPSYDQAGPTKPSERPPISPPNPDTAAAPITAGMDRKIILNAQLDLKVKDGDDVVTKLTSAVRTAGGFVQESRQEGTKQHGRQMFLSIRLPAGEYGSLLDLAASMGEVNRRREWANDVTEEYLDLEARIKTKEIHLAQLQRLYAQSGSIREMIDLEQEIARVTADLESMKGRIQYLSNQVQFSTITITLYEPGVPTPIRDPQTVWERITMGYERSWNNTVNFTGDMMVFIASSIPVVLLGLVLGGAGFGLFRLVRRSLRRPPPAG